MRTKTDEIMRAARRWKDAAEIRVARNCELRYTGRRSHDPGDSIADAGENELKAEQALRQLLAAVETACVT